MLENLRSERDDLHEFLRTKFASDRAEDTGALGIAIRSEDDDGVAVETQVAAIGAANRSLGADDNGLGDLTLFHGSVCGAFLDVDGDDIADTGGGGVLAFFADEHGATGTCVIS